MQNMEGRWHTVEGGVLQLWLWLCDGSKGGEDRREKVEFNILFYLILEIGLVFSGSKGEEEPTSQLCNWVRGNGNGNGKIFEYD
ncbi:UNVERIFIED_CONTAM: hypothetical protein Sangu_1460400 [Sesamum angustifolium]|uniref:Uncharacterized protein n=1 Tax=Sesamum angustifolium TaxID=2727405 RepID=A0AAW2N8R1_9LAMI